MAFPTTLDDLPSAADLAGHTLATDGHRALHGNLGTAIEALEAKVGVDGSAVVTSLDYKIAQLPTLTTDNAWTGQQIWSKVSAALASAVAWTGTWFTGGTTTSTKPHVLIEPAGTRSTGWNTGGTGLGVNAATGFAGNLLDLQVDGLSKLNLAFDGALTVAGALTTGSGGVVVGASGTALTPTKLTTDAGNPLILETKAAGGVVLQRATQTTDLNVILDYWTSVTQRSAAQLTATAVDSTDATRKLRLVCSVFDTAAREAWRAEADGTQAKLGFYGVSAIARAVLATGAGHTVDDVITALQNLGLVKQS